MESRVDLHVHVDRGDQLGERLQLGVPGEQGDPPACRVGRVGGEQGLAGRDRVERELGAQHGHERRCVGVGSGEPDERVAVVGQDRGGVLGRGDRRGQGGLQAVDGLARAAQHPEHDQPGRQPTARPSDE